MQMIGTSLRQHRKRLDRSVQTPEHTRAALAGKAAERKIPVTLPTLNILTLEQIEAKYGKLR